MWMTRRKSNQGIGRGDGTFSPSISVSASSGKYLLSRQLRTVSAVLRVPVILKVAGKFRRMAEMNKSHSPSGTTPSPYVEQKYLWLAGVFSTCPPDNIFLEARSVSRFPCNHVAHSRQSPSLPASAVESQQVHAAES